MDQDSFRQLLSAPRPAASAKPAATSKSKTKTVDASQPIFAPRKAKADSNTSHAPRRAGIGHKGPARETEPPASSFVPDPTIEPPPKFSLDLEAIERARAAASEKDVDELLEQTYRSKQAGGEMSTPSSSATTAPTAASSKKRTREEIVAELKNKRLKTDIEKATPPEPATAALSSKFKPIGAPKTNPKAEAKAKKEKKKKKDTAAAEPSSTTTPAKAVAVQSTSISSLGAAAKKPAPPPVEEDDIDSDADIFAGVGDYDGFEDDDDDDNAATAGPSKPNDAAPPATSADIGPGRWFKMDDELSLPTAAAQQPPPADAARSRSASPSAGDPAQPSASSSVQTIEAPLRLEALASSSISIRDVLDMDKQLEKEQLRLARKAKNKRGAGDEAVANAVQGKGRRGGEKQKMSAEAKAHQDFQKLQAFERKRGTG